MKITSASFGDNQKIPDKYASKYVDGGKNISPQISWEDEPSETKSFVIAFIDHHPIASNWVHWVVTDISQNIHSIPEGASNTGKMPADSNELDNTFGFHGYGGPQPPRGTGEHHYDATVYALDISKLNLSGRITESELFGHIQTHILDKATLHGLLGR